MEPEFKEDVEISGPPLQFFPSVSRRLDSAASRLAGEHTILQGPMWARDEGQCLLTFSQPSGACHWTIRIVLSADLCFSRIVTAPPHLREQVSFHCIKSQAFVKKCLQTSTGTAGGGKQPASPEFHPHKFQGSSRLKFCWNLDRNLLLGCLGEHSRTEIRD